MYRTIVYKSQRLQNAKNFTILILINILNINNKPIIQFHIPKSMERSNTRSIHPIVRQRLQNAKNLEF